VGGRLSGWVVGRVWIWWYGALICDGMTCDTGLSCLPEGEFRLIVRFYDYYKIYSERQEVQIQVDRADMGLWYHRSAPNPEP